MYISASSWHARVYRWWARMKYGEHSGRSNPSCVNLCPYVRAVLFWSWSRWLTRSGRIGSGRYAVRVPLVFWFLQPLWLLWAEYLLFGRGAFVLTLQIIGFVIGGLSALSVLGLLLYAIYRFFKMERVQDGLDTGAETALSFGRVIKERVVAGHHKICPIVEFREEQQK